MDCEHGGRGDEVYPCRVFFKTGGSSAGDCPYWMPQIKKPEPPKPKGIDIVMVCGESHHIDTAQPTIETVKIHGEQVYPTTDRKNSKMTVGSWIIHFLEDSVLITHAMGNNSYEFVHDCAGWVNTGKNRSTLYDDDLQPETVRYLKDNK